MNCENFYLVFQQAIDNSIASSQDLTNLVLANFWHNTTYSWEVGQAVGRLENPLGKELSISWRIASDEETN